MWRLFGNSESGPRPTTCSRWRAGSTSTTPARVRRRATGPGRRRRARPDRRGRPADLRAVLAGLAPGTGLTPNGTTLQPHPRRVPGFDLTFAVPEVGVGRLRARRPSGPASDRRGLRGGARRDDGLVGARGVLRAAGDEQGRRTVRRGASGWARGGWSPTGSSRPCSRIAPRGSVTRICTGTCWSRTWPRGSTGAGRRSTAPRSTTRHAPVAWCSRRRCAASSPQRSASSGDRCTRTRPRSPASQRGAAGVLPAARADRRVARRSRTSQVPRRRPTALLATRQAKQVPADFAAVEAGWHARADALGWGPAQLEQLLASVVPAVARSGYVVEDVTWRAGIRQVSSRLVGFDEWLDWLLDTRVTAKTATFTRFDLTQAIAAALPASTSIERRRDDRAAGPRLPRRRGGRRPLGPSAHRSTRPAASWPTTGRCATRRGRCSPSSNGSSTAHRRDRRRRRRARSRSRSRRRSRRRRWATTRPTAVRVVDDGR